ncbi:hypothetical protein IJ732_01565 [bacterium]|nr:hypothetical protein [bacterium]
MSNVDNVKDVSKVTVTQKDIEWAEHTYKTESYEESIWEAAVDDTNTYIKDYDVKIEGLQSLVNKLDVKKFVMEEDLEHVTNKGEALDRTYNELTQKPKLMLTQDERNFLDKYDENKKVIEFEKNALTFSLAEMDTIIEQKEKSIQADEYKKKILEAHRDIRVVPRYEKEAKEAKEAYDHWQELKEIAKAQEEALKEK